MREAALDTLCGQCWALEAESINLKEKRPIILSSMCAWKSVWVGVCIVLCMRVQGQMWCVRVWQEMVLILQFDDSPSDVRQCSIPRISIMHRFLKAEMHTVIHTCSRLTWTCSHEEHRGHVHLHVLSQIRRIQLFQTGRGFTVCLNYCGCDVL